MGISKTVGFIVIEAVFVYIITTLLDPIKGFILNNFTSQNLPVDDFIAGVGISAIVGATAIAVLLILQLRNYLVNRSLDIVITEKSADEKLDDLIQEIENFTTRWYIGTGIISSYRRQIEINTLRGDTKEIKKIINHASIICRKIKSVRESEVPFYNPLYSLETTVDKLIFLGSEIKKIYWSIKQNKTILQSEPERTSKILSNGDKICGELDEAITQLQLMRKNLH